MIRRIHIQNYKSLRNVEVTLKPLSVLFGPNAAGKSNFIDALQLLSRIAGSRSLKEAFEPPYRGKPMESFSFDEGGLEGLLSRDSASFRLEVDVEISPVVIDSVNKEILEMRRGHGPGADGGESKRPVSYIHHRQLRYRIEIGITPKTGVLHVADEYLAALGRDGKPKAKPQPFLERKANRIHLRMEGQSHPTYFDRYLDHAILSRPHYPPHYPHLTALRKELQSWFFYYFEPRERMRAATSVKEVRHIGLMGEELAAFLNTLRNLDSRQFAAVEKAVHSLIPSITGIRTEVNKIGEVELSLLEGNVAMPARVVSEGTLRALGLLALGGVKEPPAVIGFEEPENGVHPRRIRDITKILAARAESGNTQLIVTTHSPILPDHVPDDSLFVCRKTEGATVIEPFETWGPLGRKLGIDSALEERAEQLPVSQRLLRGDFDA
ncbi:MAG: AAA family ATPase [Bryobacteraceae bacterium]|nr:AAA family ATPase [Bryobacteraceae bacterium]